MSGGGLGGALGTALGTALAPETGGLSILAPIAGGALGATAGGALTGDRNIGRDALAGGIGGAVPAIAGASGLTGGISGMLGNTAANGIISGLGGIASGGVASGNVRDALLSGLVAGASGAGLSAAGIGGTGSDNSNSADFNSVMSGLDNAGNSGANITSVDPTASMAGEPGTPGGASTGSALSNITNWASKNPLQAAILGSMGISGLSALAPKKKVDIAGNASAVQSTDPNFTNPNLPPYHIRNNYTPYTGNWYTYGMQPEAPMVSSNAVPGYKYGGEVKYASGGALNPAPISAPISPLMSVGAPARTALATQNAFRLGHAIGSHVRNTAGVFSGTGQVKGPGGGQDDTVPAKLSRGEFVVPSDVVSHLGDGSSDAGGEKLHGLVQQVRMHKAVKGFPPKARNPLSYLSGGI